VDLHASGVPQPQGRRVPLFSRAGRKPSRPRAAAVGAGGFVAASATRYPTPGEGAPLDRSRRSPPTVPLSWGCERVDHVIRDACCGRRAGAQVESAAPRRRQHCDHGQGGGVPVGQEHLPGAVDSRSSAGTQKFQGCWSLGIAC
jgi:hypothetical protein